MDYVETHGGAASVLMNKKRSPNEVYNELDKPTYNIFWSLATHKDEFIDKIRSLEYSEQVFKWAKGYNFKMHSWQHGVAELVRRRMSRGGMGTHFAWSERLRGGRPGDVNAWETFKDLLPIIAQRLEPVVLSCGDAEKCINSFDGPNTLFYIDPPYLPETRTATEVYCQEMTRAQHISLATVLYNVKGKVILSGYDSSLYKELYRDWRKVEKTVANNSAQTKTKSLRIECLWMNY